MASYARNDNKENNSWVYAIAYKLEYIRHQARMGLPNTRKCIGKPDCNKTYRKLEGAVNMKMSWETVENKVSAEKYNKSRKKCRSTELPEIEGK